MAHALSVDLRQRVVDAIAQGMSRRRAAAGFGVSAASAIR
jgi:transposase